MKPTFCLVALLAFVSAKDKGNRCFKNNFNDALTQCVNATLKDGNGPEIACVLRGMTEPKVVGEDGNVDVEALLTTVPDTTETDFQTIVSDILKKCKTDLNVDAYSNCLDTELDKPGSDGKMTCDDFRYIGESK